MQLLKGCSGARIFLSHDVFGRLGLVPQLISTKEPAKGFGHQWDGWSDRRKILENQGNWVK